MITRHTKTPFFSNLNKILVTMVTMFLVVSLTVSFFGVPLVKATTSVFGINDTNGTYSSTPYMSANELYGVKITIPSGSGNVDLSTASALIRAFGGGANAKFIICNGTTGNVLAVSNALGVPYGYQWSNFAFSSNITLISGNSYYLFVIADAGFAFYRSNGFSGYTSNVAIDTTNSYTSPQSSGFCDTTGDIYSIYVTVGASVYAKVADGSDSVCNVNIIDMGKPFSAPQIAYTNIGTSVSLPFIIGHQYSFTAYGYGNSTVRWSDGTTNYTTNPLRLILYSHVNMTAYYTAGGTIFTGGNGGAQSGINFLSSGHGSLTWTVITEPQLGDTGNTGGLGFYGFITGDTISLLAVPDSGYTFSSFNIGTSGSGGIPYSNSPTTFTFLTNTTVVVNFIAIGSGGGNGGGNIFGSLGISDTYTAIGTYVICIVGMCIGFFYLHNNNIPFAVALGLIIATILCNILNVLGIYTYPIDALTILSIIGIIIFMRH
jgi:hypothetical protein